MDDQNEPPAPPTDQADAERPPPFRPEPELITELEGAETGRGGPEVGDRDLASAPRTGGRPEGPRNDPVVRDRLLKVLRPEAASVWLVTPNPGLGYRTPAALVAEGRRRDVLDAIDALGEGVFV